MAIRILIVDDDAGFLGLAAELLAERGFEVLDKAMDSDQALAAAVRERPDGILLDINLPGRDGFATATALSDAGVPVVYVDPAWTSRTCADCGHAGKRNRVSQAIFTCRGCGVVCRRCQSRAVRWPPL